MRTTLCFGQSDDSLQTFVESILKVPPITNSDSEFEIQLIVDIQLSKRDHFVLIKKEQGQWHGRSFTYTSDDRQDSFKLDKARDEKMNEDWDLAVRKTVADNFFDIPDQEEAEDKLMKDYELNNGEGARFIVMDGTTYLLTIKANGKVKKFHLHSPWSYLEEFPNSKELRWYCDVLDLIDKNVKIKLQD